METTFISIHDLTVDAKILYASSSIVDILGWAPEEVVGRSCWDYFHPEELPFARAKHGRGVYLDKAAVLSYCQIKSKDNQWIGCECCFTVVHDVLVACTSIYKRDFKSQKRAVEAPIIRRLFSSSPPDPRYHMLSELSSKFSRGQPHEPRAALFINRFSRTLPIMYATNSLIDIVGISAEEMKEKSFYYCIEEECLAEAIKCLESAKANDSIAYLRFWFRDPRQAENEAGDGDEDMDDVRSSEEDEDEGGVHLNGQTPQHNEVVETRNQEFNSASGFSSNTSGNSTDIESSGNEQIFDNTSANESSSSSLHISSPTRERPPRTLREQEPQRLEVEAVVSCTSDGLVVVLRRARPVLAFPQQLGVPAHATGVFAAPWASEPIMPEPEELLPTYQRWSFNGAFLPNLAAARSNIPSPPSGPPVEDFMNVIRDVACFAWALTGINGSLANYARGRATGESQPPDGLPIWDPKSANSDTHDGTGLHAGWPPVRYTQPTTQSMFTGLTLPQPRNGSVTIAGADPSSSQNNQLPEYGVQHSQGQLRGSSGNDFHGNDSHRGNTH